MRSQVLVIVLLLITSCHSQSKKNDKKTLVGGPCQGCEAVFEYGDKVLTDTDTLPNFSTTSPKLKLTGSVYENDGKTPAKNVILYIYQTNREGIYPKKSNSKGWAQRHGYLRGWVKTNNTGKYTFFTYRPAAYPNLNTPEHIHLTVKEPDKNEYYLEDFLFDDDPLLTQSKRKSLRNRGGSGIVNPSLKNGILTVNRDIVLGKNIPNY
ncbi:dioxygenase family protein [Spongiivirga citrea]|uniref:Intradiol ring-cleavage dioxygenase n=1 Tax=Spongiivirga citrea TaxID=1481457 RepID=A0A6M0CJI3_9FLAO|nr:intradiol ring-cleavage dioxygenase [Spongiivirga citrea]NER18086.1 intradiol ring-cleavage dioxygenase [Spongiivirga citrea]